MSKKYKTDENGEIKNIKLTEGKHNVYIASSVFNEEYDGDFTVVESEETQVIKLTVNTYETDVQISVTDSIIGDVVSGASITAVHELTDKKYSAVTGTDGVGELKNVYLGNSSILISKEGYYDFKVDSVAISDEEHEFTYSLTPTSVSGNVSVKLTDADTGDGIEAVTVKLGDKYGVTGSAGGCTIKEVPFGTYDVVLEGLPDNYDSSTLNPSTFTVESAESSLNLVVSEKKSSTVNFTVTSDYEALYDASILLTDGEEVIASAITNTEGKAVITIKYGAYECKVSKDGYEDYSQTLTVDSETLYLSVDLKATTEKGKITFTVTDKDKNPIADATIKIYKNESLYKTLTTDTDGKAIINLEYGEYTYIIKKTGYNDMTNIVNVQKDEEIDVELVKMSELTIKVTDDEENPIENAKINLSSSLRTTIDYYTDAEGVAVINIPKATYTCNVSKEGYEGVEQTINVNSDTMSVEIVLSTLPYTEITFYGSDFTTCDNPFTYTGDIGYTVDDGEIQTYTGGALDISDLASKSHTLKIYGNITKINDNCFDNCNNIGNITLSETITSLGSYAFNNCTELDNVNFTESITSIGLYCFAECSNLNGILLPTSIQELKEGCFKNCTSLSNITIPYGIIKIGMSSFEGCTALQQIVIPNSVTLLGTNCFKDCKYLVDINLNGKLQTIGANCFQNCVGLQNLKIYDNIVVLNDCCFLDCSNIENVYFQSVSPPSIGNDAFSGIADNPIAYVPSGTSEDYTNALKNCGATFTITEKSTINSIGNSDGKIEFTVLNSKYEEMEGVTINIYENDSLCGSVITNEKGIGTIELEYGQYTCKTSKSGYVENKQTFDLSNPNLYISLVLSKE